MTLILNLHVEVDIASITFTASMMIVFSYAVKVTFRKCKKRTKDKAANSGKSAKDKSKNIR